MIKRKFKNQKKRKETPKNISLNLSAMFEITSLRTLPILENLHITRPIHPLIDELVENFQEYGELAEIDPDQLERDPILKDQVEWTHLMINYFRRIPEKYLHKVPNLHWDFSSEEVRQFMRIKTAKERGVIILHVVVEDEQIPLTKEKVLENILHHLEGVYQDLIKTLNLPENKQEIDRLESKAGRTCNAREWATFNRNEVSFLRKMIIAKTTTEKLSCIELKLKSDTGFYELYEKTPVADRKKELLNSPFLDRLRKEDPNTCEVERCIQEIISQNDKIRFETGIIKLTVLESGHEWAGFVFKFDVVEIVEFRKHLQKRFRSSYNKYHILNGPMDDECSNGRVFGVMRVGHSLYPDCEREYDSNKTFSLCLSEFTPFCNICGNIEDDETYRCVQRCGDRKSVV